MPLDNPHPGPNNVSEYLASAIPWVTASTVSAVRQFDFPHVTSFYTVKNVSSGTIKIGFTLNGINGSNYFTLFPSASLTATHRVKTLFISGSYATPFELVVGLTMIPERMFPTLTGSAGNSGIG